VSDKTTGDLERRIRAIEDRLEIYDLIASHPMSADTAAGDYIASCWTEDGHFDRGDAGKVSGRAAIVQEVFGPNHQAALANGIAHFASLPHVAIDGDTAVVTSYLQIIVPETRGEPLSVSGHGASRGYHLHRVSANRWELVRGAKGWEIKQRFARPVGSPAFRELLGRRFKDTKAAS